MKKPDLKVEVGVAIDVAKVVLALAVLLSVLRC
jgi:hypothetical protein